MSTFTRLFDEHSELVDRYDKLSAFLGSERVKDLDEHMLGLMTQQKFHMRALVNILAERLDILTSSASAEEDPQCSSFAAISANQPLRDDGCDCGTDCSNCN